MKRVAIILGSPFPQNSEAHLRGVREDVSNYKKFLLSATGGAWREDEIHIGIHLVKSKVPVIQRLCADADMAIIVYSGHGFMRHGENYLNINPNQNLNVSDLVTTAKRQITIVDACRTDYPYEHFEGIGGLGIHFDNTRPDIARALYDYYINNSPYGSFTIFSSSRNQASQDTEDGGRFSVSLLSDINHWSYNTAGLCMTVESAFTRSRNQLASEYAVQVPEAFYTGYEIPNFPLSVSSRAYIKRFGLPTSTKSVPSKQRRTANVGTGVFWGLTAFALGVAILT